MSTDYQTYQLIQDYLEGNLSEEQIQTVHQRASEDSEFSQLLEEEKSMQELLKGVVVNEIKEEVSQAFQAEKDKDLKNKGIRNIIGGLGFLLIGLLFLWNPFAEKVEDTKLEEIEIPNHSTTPSKELVDKKDEVSPVENSPTSDNSVQPTLHSTNAHPLPTVENEEGKEELVTAVKKDTNLVKQEESVVAIKNETSASKKREQATVETVENPCEGLDITIDFEKNAPCILGEKGTAMIEIDGGKEPYTFTLNGKNTDEGTFENLVKGNYSLVVKDANNCKLTTKKFELTPKRCQELLLAFNPEVDSWVYETSDEIVQLRILSRFGKEVFRTESESPTWDGRDNSGEMLVTDDYIFIISKNDLVIDKGNVTIVRQ